MACLAAAAARRPGPARRDSATGPTTRRAACRCANAKSGSGPDAGRTRRLRRRPAVRQLGRSSGPGQQVTMSVLVDNAQQLFSAPMRIRYDQRVLSLVDVARGDFLPGPEMTDVIFSKNVRNQPGWRRSTWRDSPARAARTATASCSR
ncbi:MAG: cohesin domain-containing protein [Bryobacterales bacterium]